MDRSGDTDRDRKSSSRVRSTQIGSRRRRKPSSRSASKQGSRHDGDLDGSADDLEVVEDGQPGKAEEGSQDATRSSSSPLTERKSDVGIRRSTSRLRMRSDRHDGGGRRSLRRSGRGDTGRRSRRSLDTTSIRRRSDRLEEEKEAASQVAREEMEALRHDLGNATKVQSNLLPKKLPVIDGVDISAFYRPSKEVGGDYYDFIDVNEERLAMVVADVSGKGIAGSMVMTMFRTILRMHCVGEERIAPVLIKANRFLAGDIKKGMFVTCAYLLLHKRSRTVRLCSAGHNPVIVWRQNTGRCHLVNPNGIAMGFDRGQLFERTIVEQKFRMDPGDRVFAYTDGVVELMNPRSEEYGEKRLLEVIRKHAAESSGKLINILMEDLDRYRDQVPQSDDITIVTFRVRT